MANDDVKLRKLALEYALANCEGGGFSADQIVAFANKFYSFLVNDEQESTNLNVVPISEYLDGDEE